MPLPQSQATSVVSTPHPSPFRYPGGKSWLAPYVRQWLRSLERRVRFAEPFAGGANVGLTVALEDLAEHVTLVELDRDVAAVWETVLNGHARHLADRILSFRMSNRSLKAVLARRCILIAKPRLCDHRQEPGQEGRHNSGWGEPTQTWGERQRYQIAMVPGDS